MSRVKPFFSRVFGSRSTHGYCAFCKAERKYTYKKHLSFFDVMAALITSLVFASAAWGPFDPRALVLFALFVGAGEIFVYLRWRLSIVCRYCGFDPVLYNISPGRAREKVRQFYESQIRSPQFLLSKSPLLEFHKMRMEQERLKLKLQRVKARPSRVPANVASEQSLPPSSP